MFAIHPIIIVKGMFMPFNVTIKTEALQYNLQFCFLRIKLVPSVAQCLRITISFIQTVVFNVHSETSVWEKPLWKM